MAVFLIKRLMQAVFVFLAVTLLVSWAIRLTGDPALMLTQGAGSISEADLARIRDALGLNQPFLSQYGQFLLGILTFDLGRSFSGGVSVSLLVAQALPATLGLALLAMLVSIAISIPLGVVAAVRKGRVADQIIRVVSLLGLSMPNFWLGTMLMLFFSIYLGWLAPSGLIGVESFIMPALTMGIILTATNVRLVRTTMLEVLNAQYIIVARAKGLSERKVLYKHALRNCAVPLITYLGLQFGGLLGGIVVVEKVFNWPGLGTLAFEAVAARDYPTLQAVIAILALSIIVINLLTDVIYGLVDPRIRMK